MACRPSIRTQDLREALWQPMAAANVATIQYNMNFFSVNGDYHRLARTSLAQWGERNDLLLVAETSLRISLSDSQVFFAPFFSKKNKLLLCVTAGFPATRRRPGSPKLRFTCFHPSNSRRGGRKNDSDCLAPHSRRQVVIESPATRGARNQPGRESHGTAP